MIPGSRESLRTARGVKADLPTRTRARRSRGELTGQTAPLDQVFSNDTTHAVENVGATEARALAIELKPCTR
jgi:hypothetical protein